MWRLAGSVHLWLPAPMQPPVASVASLVQIAGTGEALSRVCMASLGRHRVFLLAPLFLQLLAVCMHAPGRAGTPAVHALCRSAVLLLLLRRHIASHTCLPGCLPLCSCMVMAILAGWLVGLSSLTWGKSGDLQAWCCAHCRLQHTLAVSYARLLAALHATRTTLLLRLAAVAGSSYIWGS